MKLFFTNIANDVFILFCKYSVPINEYIQGKHKLVVDAKKRWSAVEALISYDRENFLMALAPKVFEYGQIGIKFHIFLEVCRIF